MCQFVVLFTDSDIGIPSDITLVSHTTVAITMSWSVSTL